LILGVAFSLVGCDSGLPANDPSSVGAQVKERQTNCPIVDYGNGVMYFDCTKADFGNALSRYLGKDLEVTSITGDGTTGYGEDLGYWVTVRPKVAADAH
jgi:hypothetical protein